MYPVLFAPDATSWESFGIGVLSDTISCEVEENRNGSYELEMRYPITGAYFDQIALRCLVVAKPNYTDNPQPFRIYNISKPLNGVVTINAQHISYDLSGYIDAPFTAVGIQEAIRKMISDSVVYPTGCPFTITSTNSSTATMNVYHPTSVRALMGGTQESLLDVYGGEWHFDGYNCIFDLSRGADRGVVIRYGKNLTDLRQEENNASVYTAVYPYFYNSESHALVVLPEKVIAVPGTFDFTRIMQLDLSSEFQETPTEEQLRTAAEHYIVSRNIGVPDVNLTIGFIEADSMQDRVDLCDTVTVVFEKLGVSATAKCIRTKWDVLKGRYIEAELGNAKSSFVSAIVESKEMEETLEKYSSQLNSIAYGIISKVTGNTGGYIVMHDTNNDGEPDEILIMDEADINQAVNIIRMNRAGIAFTKSGYTGQYTTAWNINGDFVANFIAAGELQTDRVTILGDSQFYWDNANITMVDPLNVNRVIRFGCYDGTHYGLGFSLDGGHTWRSGFSFDGISMIADVDNAGYAKMDGDSFDIINASGVSIAHIGNGRVICDDGTYDIRPFYRLGTYKTGSDHGEYSFSAGRLCSPGGPYSVCCGYNNTTKGYGGIAIGRDSTVHGYGIAMGILCESYGSGQSGDIYLGSVAIGQNSRADFSGVAIGAGCFARSSDDSYSNGGVAIGNGAKAGMRGVAIGEAVNASYKTTNYTVAIGYHCSTTGHDGIAIGSNCSSVNIDAALSGDPHIAIGSSCTATSRNSSQAVIAMGSNCDAEATSLFDIAIAMGISCTSSNGVAIGRFLIADHDGQFVCGRYNVANTGAFFVVGNGTGSNSRSNACLLSSSGNMWVAGTYSNGSDGRYKTKTGEAPDLSAVRALKYRWHDDGIHDQQEHIGYIAQDVEPLAPYLVQTDENTGFKSLDYIGLLCAKVEQLERKVEQLTARVEELEARQK